MSMEPLYPGLQPLGKYDLVDTELASITGGEVVTLTTASRTNSASEKAAYDARDGYLYDEQVTTTNRPAVTRASSASVLPLYLCDDGTTGYGTLLGQTVGAPVGLSTSGTDLGPNTAAASGKVTLWHQPGQYKVSVSSAASDFVSTIPLGGLAPGSVLGFGSGADLGQLAHTDCSNKVTNSGVGYFVEFESSASLVTTPNKLVGATEQWPDFILDFHAGHGTRTV